MAGYDGKKFPPIFDRTCGQPIMELTDKLDEASDHISAMTASGMTYIPAGLQWGWRALSESAPLAGSNSKDRKKLLILMTDGQNTRSQSGATHSGSDWGDADSFTLELCEAIKAEDIQIATVAYSNGGGISADAGILSNCASSPELYFSANDPKALLDAFSSAADQSEDIRLIR